MRICVLLSSYEDSSSPFKDIDPSYDPRPWLPEHDVRLAFVRKVDAAEHVASLVREGHDVFLNLCEGTADEDIAGVEVIEALERHGAAYTGPDAAFYTVDKAAMKRAARRLGVPTPREVFAFDEAGIDEAAQSLRFPLIVKHFNGYASVGMTRASRVEHRDALAREARRVIEAHGGALVEEYVDGGELTALVVEDPADPGRPRVLRPIELVFPPGEGFKHGELKWVSYDTMGHRPCTDAALLAQIEASAARLFVELGGRSYGRCDYRIDAEGRPYFLEINAGCGVFYPPGAEGSADLILKLDPAGHRGFVEAILRGAIARRRP